MYLSSISVVAIVSAFLGLSHALPSPIYNAEAMKSARSTNTCADTSLLQTVYQTFVPGLDVHALDWISFWENYNTVHSAVAYNDIRPAFPAWPTQQESTVPLFQLATADASQIIYRTGADAATPPVVNGFGSFIKLLGWVYPSQVCGSVPLLSAVQAAHTDHYFTTNPFEHSGLLALGWTDGGVVAYVMPLNSS